MMIIEEPYYNGYCEKCKYNDGDYDNLCCIKGNYCNCGAVIICRYFRECKEVKDDGQNYNL